jgi:uncharacterized protein YecT (DUF1311 family)
MKKIISLCLIILISFSFISCKGKAVSTNAGQQNSNTVKTPDKVTDKAADKATGQADQKESNDVRQAQNYGVYDMSGEYIKTIENNPIDHDNNIEMKNLNNSQNYSTQAVLGLEYKYIKIWDDELNSIYNKLLSNLNVKEKGILLEAQKGWLAQHLKETEFVNQVFYQRESGPILGSQGRIQMQEAIKGRLRQRTLELMEYYEMLGNKVEFVYKSTVK